MANDNRGKDQNPDSKGFAALSDAERGGPPGTDPQNSRQADAPQQGDKNRPAAGAEPRPTDSEKK